MSALRDRALTPAGVLAPGHRLGRYEILTKLASGGMAVVYVASAQGAAGFERLVALKVLHANLAHEEEFIGMFLDEARLAARIRHPNVVATIDISDTIETGYYLVMEYVEGDHLGALLSGAHKLGERMPVPVVLRVMIDALGGLGAAHDLRDDAGNPLNIVHRDVSPHNILIGRDGIGRLTDFGVAKAEGRLTHTRDGQVKGKLAYMAPEQASSGATDSRSDLFSAGIILWECVTGRRLFRADNTAATLMKLLSEPIVAPSTIDPELAPLDPVLKKALDRDPAARFQTAEEFIEAIEWVAGRMGGVASPRAVTKAVKQYAAEKLARDRRLIEAAQRSIRGGAGNELFPEGTDPSMHSGAGSEISLRSASMSRSKTGGVFSSATAPRLFTRGRSSRPTPSETSMPMAALEAPPPIGQMQSLGVPAVPDGAIDDVEPPRGRGPLVTLVLVAIAITGLGAWLASGSPGMDEPGVRALPLPPQAAATPLPVAVEPSVPIAVVDPAQPSVAPPAQLAQPEPAAATVEQPAPAARRVAPRPTPSPRVISRPKRPAGATQRQAPAVPAAPKANSSLLPNPYTR